MDLNMKIAVMGTALIVLSATSFAYYATTQPEVIQLQENPPEAKNIRKNSITFYFDEYHGNITGIDFNYSIVDEGGKEIELKVEDVIDIGNTKDTSGVTFIGEQSYAVKIEYWVNQILNKVKEEEKIE